MVHHALQMEGTPKDIRNDVLVVLVVRPAIISDHPQQNAWFKALSEVHVER